MNVREPAAAYDFGPFRLHPTERLLLRDGAPVAVTPKVFDLLATFVRGRGRALAKEELLNTIWPDTFVEEASLTRTVSMLRQVLGSAGRDYIETVSKFGYRFNAPVREAAPRASTSIAVQPFTHLGNGDTSYLAIGLADALIARLAHIRQLAVRPLRIVDKPLTPQELQVDLALEGTIRTADERIRVSTHLVDGSGSIVWSGRFDSSMTDLFAIEDAIAEQIVAALAVQLTPGEQRQLAKRQTANADAYRLYLKGRHFWNKRTGESLQKAIEYFDEAIACDPNFAAAYCGLADSYLLAPGADAATAAARARAAAEKALQLDESLGEAHTTLARIEMAFDWNWSAAEERFARAVELSPEYLTARLWRANFFCAAGRFDEAIAEIEHARAIDPLSVPTLTASGWIHYMARRFDDSIARYREALEIDPGFAHARRQIAMPYEQAGKIELAIATLHEMNDQLTIALLAHAYASAGKKREARDAMARLAPETNSALLQIIAATQLQLGDRAAVLAFLNRAVDAKASTLMWLGVDPWFDAMREDRAFRAILRRVGFT